MAKYSIFLMIGSSARAEVAVVIYSQSSVKTMNIQQFRPSLLLTVK